MPRMKKRSDGRYVKTFTVDGTRYYAYARNQKDLPEAVAAKKKEIIAKKSGQKEDHDNPVLNDFFEIFYDNLKQHVKESTLHTKRDHYKAVKDTPLNGGHVLGELRIKNITSTDMEQVQTALKKRGMRPTTINMTMATLKQIFRYAINSDILVKNPCRTLHNIPPDGIRARDTIHRSLTDKEISSFLKAAERRHSFYLPLFIFALNTGCRIGEIGGLTEAEIKDGRVSIVRTLAKGEMGGLIFQSPKTQTGKRTFELNQDALKALDMQRELLKVCGLDHRPAQISQNEYYPSLPTLFCTQEGYILNEGLVNSEISRCCKESGVAHFSSHAFRDTFASHYARLYPTDWKTLQGILGHSDAKMTLNLYVHEDEKRRSETMKNFQILA